MPDLRVSAVEAQTGAVPPQNRFSTKMGRSDAASDRDNAKEKIGERCKNELPRGAPGQQRGSAKDSAV